jgi:bacillithiol biosynthesis cysteine-adding enzyme BshC
MQNDCISYQKSGYFSKLITDYLDEKFELKPLYNRFPKIENFKEQLIEKQNNFPFENRQILVAELEKQYANFNVSDATREHIKRLNQISTFTITTGHQLNLFTGPLYFLYKIVSTINLCKELKKKFPDNNFVPIYWMATEDHDFEEINYFNYKNTKIKWNRESSGPVGRLSTAGLDAILKEFSSVLGIGQNAEYLKSLFHKSYVEQPNLADATRYLANELFKEEGLVIIDGDSIALKRLFIPFVEKELVEQTSFDKVTQTNKLLKDYFVQVNPREINLFYIEDTVRERIIFTNNVYQINNTLRQFTKNEILTELKNHPEKFSPNVILRPLYQEVVLPNLCYVGGGGELAYWFELKSNFEENKITFPMLLLRNSVVLATQKQVAKAAKLNVSWDDLFLHQQELSNSKTKELSQLTIDFSGMKENLVKQFEALHEIAKQTDKSFTGAVKAQEIKQIKGLEHLEKRLLKAEKKVHAEILDRILVLQNELFPNQTLQERNANFSEFYIESGPELITTLLKKIDPLEPHFRIITL